MHTTQTGDEALIARLQERVRKLEETIAKHGQASSSARREVELSDSSVESELSEDEHVFNRLQLDGETGEHRHYGPPSIMMLQASSTSLPTSLSTPDSGACNIPLATPVGLDWRRHLPPMPGLQMSVHDQMLVLCLRSFSFYNIVEESFFWRDMVACLSDPTNTVTRTPHYSPLLHITTLLCGTHLVDDTVGSSEQSRAALLELAHEYLLSEGDRPSLSTIKGSLMLGQYYTAERLLGLGYMYTGMAMRFSHMLGLSLPKSSTLLSAREEEDRNHMYWCLQLYDKLWSHFYGHPPTLPLLPSHSSLPSVQEWQDRRLWAQNTNGPGSKSMQSTTLHWTARLVEVVEEILYTVYSVGAKPYSPRTQRTVTMLGERLRSWWSSLPSELRTATQGRPPGHVLTLIGYYHYTTILLFRPYYLRRNASHDPSMSQRASVLCSQAGLEISQLLIRYEQLWGLRTAPIIWTQIGFAGYTAHLLRMANDADATTAHAAFDDATAVIYHLRRLGPPFGSALQFADTMAHALQEWEPASPTVNPPAVAAQTSVGADEACRVASIGEDSCDIPSLSSTGDADDAHGPGSWTWDSAPSLATAPIYDFFALLDSEHGVNHV